MNFTFIILSKDKETIERINSLTRELKVWKCLSISEDYQHSVNFLLRENPDVVFVDLDLCNGNSIFENLKELSHFTEQLPDFIGLASTRNYAYESLKFGFVDYLLKPLNELDLRKSLMKHQKKTSGRSRGTLCLKSYSDYHFIEISNISYLQADNNTTDIYLNSGTKITAFKTLKFFEQKLPATFIRIHNSYIINMDQVRRINFGKSQISLAYHEECEQLPFSKSYRQTVNNLRNILASNNILNN